jgi:hypothetical protein
MEPFDISADTQEPKGAAHHESSIMEDRSPKRRRIGEEDE